MKTIYHVETLFYYDGPQIFEGRDDTGAYYIAMLINDEGKEFIYMAAEVDPEKLALFRDGKLDLRDLFLDRSINDWYIATPTNKMSEPMNMELQTTPLAESHYLPTRGFVLDFDDEDVALDAVETVQQAVQQQVPADPLPKAPVVPGVPL